MPVVEVGRTEGTTIPVGSGSDQYMSSTPVPCPSGSESPQISYRFEASRQVLLASLGGRGLILVGLATRIEDSQQTRTAND